LSAVARRAQAEAHRSNPEKEGIATPPAPSRDDGEEVSTRELMALEHFQEKWNPVFRPKMRPRKNLERFQFP